VIVLSFTIVIPREIRLMRENLVKRNEVAIDIVSKNIAAALEFEDSDLAHGYLRSFDSFGEVTDAIVFDSEDKLFVEYHKDSANSAPAIQLLSRSGTFYEENHLVIVKPIRKTKDDLVQGSIVVRCTTVELSEQIEYLFLLMGILIVAMFFLVGVFSYFLQGLISKPIVELAEVADRISKERDYSIRVKKLGDDETGRLYDRFNGMLEQIGARDHAIRALNEELTGASKEAIEAQEDAIKAKEDAIKAKEMAENANRIKSQFLANMSHELRTPLNGVLGYAQLLAEQDDIPEQHREKIRIINKSGMHLLDLINDILDITKIEVGKMELHAEEFEINGFLEGLYNMFSLKCDKKRIALDIGADANVPKYMKADAGKLRQCLINLLGNAVKFTHQGRISLRVTLDPNGQIRFAVQDSGRGIPSDKIEEIVQPFKQHYDQLNTEGGTGLGLAITKNYVEMLGGKFDITSEIDKGSCFSFAINVEVVEHVESDQRKANHKITGYISSKPVKILVVDGNQINLDVAQKLLAIYNFEIETASNGKIAVEKAESFLPHAILMDIHMDVMGGEEATNFIKGSEWGKDMKIIALTASVFNNRRTDLLENGFDDFLSKPYRIETLVETIAHHLSLTLTYTEIVISPSKQETFSFDAAALQSIRQLIPIEVLDELMELIEDGDYKKIEQMIAAMPDADANIAKLQRYISRETKEFNFDKIDDIVRQLSALTS
jgi:signal transduction histidine kinase/DNA-binding NarL/FixJ family response regulator